MPPSCPAPGHDEHPVRRPILQRGAGGGAEIGVGQQPPAQLRGQDLDVGTEAQAVQLASSLYRNYTFGGAVVVVRVPYSATVSVGITGPVQGLAGRDHRHHAAWLSPDPATAASELMTG